MKAIVCRKLGPPSNLSLEECPAQDISDECVRIKICAAGVNFPDILMVAGKYQHKPALPFIPGFEVSGQILETGKKCSRLRVGDKVIASMRTGGYAEECIVPTVSVRHLPASFSFSQGAVFQVAYSTAYVSLVSKGMLLKQETLLVHGAAGGVGLAAVQLGKALGAEVIATVGTEKKVALTKRAGADHVIVINSDGFREQVKELTNGNGADVIYDPVGGDIFDESLRCVAWGGRLLVVGFAGGRIPAAPANRILIKGCSIIGVRAGEFARRHPNQGNENYEVMLKMADKGLLKPHIHAEVPLTQASRAMDLLTQRKVVGKVVLVP